MLIPLASGLVTVLKLTPSPASLVPVVDESQVMFPFPSKSSEGSAGAEVTVAAADVSLVSLKSSK